MLLFCSFAQMHIFSLFVLVRLQKNPSMFALLLIFFYACSLVILPLEKSLSIPAIYFVAFAFLLFLHFYYSLFFASLTACVCFSLFCLFVALYISLNDKCAVLREKLCKMH